MSWGVKPRSPSTSPVCLPNVGARRQAPAGVSLKRRARDRNLFRAAGVFEFFKQTA